MELSGQPKSMANFDASTSEHAIPPNTHHENQEQADHTETITDLFRRRIQGAVHMHTVGLNPEGNLEASLSLEQQVQYLQTIAIETDEKPAYPLGFITVTNHAEHIGLRDDQLARWLEEGKLTQAEYQAISRGKDKRKVPRYAPGTEAAPGSDGWGLCTDEENQAMAKAASLHLREEIDQIRELQEQTVAIKIFSGVEVSITKNGQLTIADVDTLKALDVVIASPHGSGFDHTPLANNPEDLVAIYTKVAESQPVTILGHPFIDRSIAEALGKQLWDEKVSRQLSSAQKVAIVREQLEPLLGPFLDTLRQRRVAFEFNLKSPMPRPLQEAMLILAKDHGTLLSIGTDGHQILQWRDDVTAIATSATSTEPELQKSYSAEVVQAAKKYQEDKTSLTPQERITLDGALARQKLLGIAFPMRLARLLRLFDTYEIPADQVITSSRNKMEQFIAAKKSI